MLMFTFCDHACIESQKHPGDTNKILYTSTMANKLVSHLPNYTDFNPSKLKYMI